MTECPWQTNSNIHQAFSKNGICVGHLLLEGLSQTIKAGKLSQKTSHEVSAFKCSSWQSQKEIDFSNKTKKAIAEIDA